MINQNYTKERYQRGFMNKCAELRVDPKAVIRKAMLMKRAQAQKYDFYGIPRTDTGEIDLDGTPVPMDAVTDDPPKFEPVNNLELKDNVKKPLADAANWYTRNLSKHPYLTAAGTLGAVGAVTMTPIIIAMAVKRAKKRRAISNGSEV